MRAVFDNEPVGKCRFIYMSYSREFFWWEIINTFRKLLLAAAIIIYNPIARFLVILTIMLFYR